MIAHPISAHVEAMTAPLTDSAREDIAETFGRIALAAGRVVMKVYAGAAHARAKADASPVCDADEQAEALILAALAREFPDIPVVAEESVARGIRPDVGERFILVDPVDGTREFLARNADRVVTRTMLLEAVWDFHFDPKTNIVETHMSRLRGKLAQHGGAELIHTVRGAGYALRAPPPERA